MAPKRGGSSSTAAACGQPRDSRPATATGAARRHDADRSCRDRAPRVMIESSATIVVDVVDVETLGSTSSRRDGSTGRRSSGLEVERRRASSSSAENRRRRPATAIRAPPRRRRRRQNATHDAKRSSGFGDSARVKAFDSAARSTPGIVANLDRPIAGCGDRPAEQPLVGDRGQRELIRLRRRAMTVDHFGRGIRRVRTPSPAISDVASSVTNDFAGMKRAVNDTGTRARRRGTRQARATRGIRSSIAAGPKSRSADSRETPPDSGETRNGPVSSKPESNSAPSSFNFDSQCYHARLTASVSV